MVFIKRLFIAAGLLLASLIFFSILGLITLGQILGFITVMLFVFILYFILYVGLKIYHRLLRVKFFFATTKEGTSKITSRYRDYSNNDSEAYADYLSLHIKKEFHAFVDIRSAMLAIQTFRVLHYSKKDHKGIEISAEVDMIFIEDNFNRWCNKFDDYMFKDGSFVPKGIRVGIKYKDKIILDPGIFFSVMHREVKI